MRLESLSEVDPSRNPLILIVDDIPKNIQLLGSILAREGYNIAVATSGRQALGIIEKKPPDLVLLDIMMPEIDGFEVCRRIKENELSKEIPVIFLSAKHEVEDKVKGFALGGSDYITKPFETSEVLARVHTHLRLKTALDTIQHYNHQLEQIVEERTGALVRAERHAAFSLLIQGIVHNLRNPLNAISGALQLMEMEKERVMPVVEVRKGKIWDGIKKSHHSLWHYAQMAETGTEKLMSMINSLMAKSRSDSSEEVERIDLNQLLQREIEFLSADEDFKNQVQKEIWLSEQEIVVEVIPGEIAQVFHNLIRNALDATHQQPDATLTIRSGSKGELAWFSVSDNGPGISDEHQKLIFDPFFTTKPKADSDAQGPKGTGLGLHICSEMVRAYGGGITVTSTLGDGATFTVSLPPRK